MSLQSQTEQAKTLHTLLRAYLLYLNATSIVLYPYSPSHKEWSAPLWAGEWSERRRPGRGTLSTAAQRILVSKEPQWWEDFLTEAEFEADFLISERTKSVAGIPLVDGREIIGVLFVSFSAPHKFTPPEKIRIELFTNELTSILKSQPFTRIDSVELISPRLLRVRLAVPSLLTANEYIDTVINWLWAIDFVYLVFALINSGKLRTIKKFLALFREQPDQTALAKSQIRTFFASTSIESLRLASVQYGSSACIDLLGVGKVIEILRDTIKDLIRPVGQEKQMTDLEHQIEQVDIGKIKLETDKLILDMATQKLEIMEKASLLSLSDDDKKTLIAVLVAQLTTIATPSSVPSLGKEKTGKTVEK
jgi:hypothetical protein